MATGKVGGKLGVDYATAGNDKLILKLGPTVVIDTKKWATRKLQFEIGLQADIPVLSLSTERSDSTPVTDTDATSIATRLESAIEPPTIAGSPTNFEMTTPGEERSRGVGFIVPLRLTLSRVWKGLGLGANGSIGWTSVSTTRKNSRVTSLTTEETSTAGRDQFCKEAGDTNPYAENCMELPPDVTTHTYTDGFDLNDGISSSGNALQLSYGAHARYDLGATGTFSFQAEFAREHLLVAGGENLTGIRTGVEFRAMRDFDADLSAPIRAFGRGMKWLVTGGWREKGAPELDPGAVEPDPGYAP